MPAVYPKENASCSNVIAFVGIVEVSAVPASFVYILSRVISEFVGHGAKGNLQGHTFKKIEYQIR